MNTILYTVTLSAGRKLHVVHGDLTMERVDAIVNAANSYLQHGGGVAGAIVQRGGEIIQVDSDAWIAAHGPVPTGSAAWTGGGRLHARFVIHAVGPVWQKKGDEAELLCSAVQSALGLADERGARSIALPAISSGIFGYPKPQAVKVIWDAVVEYAAVHPESALHEIRLCNIDRETCELFVKCAKEYDRAG